MPTVQDPQAEGQPDRWPHRLQSTVIGKVRRSPESPVHREQRLPVVFAAV